MLAASGESFPAREDPAVAVYRFDLDAHTGPSTPFAAWLSGEERLRADAFRFPRDRRRYILRHGWLRGLLSRALDQAPAEIAIQRDPFGKPFVAGKLRFSLSHADGVAIAAIARGLEIGCDIAHLDPRVDMAAVVHSLFSASERAAWEALAPASRTAAFFRAWAMKEAYVKARGQGLALPLDRFEVALDPTAPPALLAGCEGWSVRLIDIGETFAAAIVAAGTSWRLATPQTL